MELLAATASDTDRVTARKGHGRPFSNFKTATKDEGPH